MIVIHGNNVVLSREHLKEIKDSYLEVVEFNGKTLSITDFVQALESSTFLAETRLVVLEGLFSSKKNATDIFTYLKDTNPKDLVVWEDKEVGKRDLSQLPHAQIYSYKLPSLIFRFVDLVAQRDILPALKLYEDLLLQVTPEVIWYMLVRQWRFLLLAQKEDKDGPTDFQRLPSWQRTKLTQLSKAYTLEKLKSFYRQLLRINFREKSGKANLTLEKQIEMLLLFELKT